jgi:hypothetical protein
MFIFLFSWPICFPFVIYIRNPGLDIFLFIGLFLVSMVTMILQPLAVYSIVSTQDWLNIINTLTSNRWFGFLGMSGVLIILKDMSSSRWVSAFIAFINDIILKLS